MVFTAGALAIAGCGRSRELPGGAGGAGTGTGTGTGTATGSGTGAGGAGGTAAPSACAGEPLPPKRVVRLSFAQAARSVEALLGSEAAARIRAEVEIADGAQRTFPPLANPREGTVVTDAVWQNSDALASTVAAYAAEHLESVTGCGAPPDDACARAFVPAFAARAYRRPLTAEEAASLLQVYDEAAQALGNVAEALQMAVYATLSAPQFLYRTELGEGADIAGALAPAELAALLSYFLTDGPPDGELLEAAARGALTTGEQLARQVDRLLALPSTRLNLEAALMSYFGLPQLQWVVIDTTREPRWNPMLAAAMLREAELFLRNTVWSAPLPALLTSRRTSVDFNLAPLYGIPFPPAAGVDGEGWAMVDLPADRAGLLTQAAWLTSRARPDIVSVTQRGFAVQQAFVCDTVPPFAPADPEHAMPLPPPEATERQKVDARLADPACRGCHVTFDPYGVALLQYDLLGGRRVVDDAGRPLDATIALPPVLGGRQVSGAADLARELAASGRFTACLARGFAAYALAEPAAAPAVDGCAVRDIAAAADAGDGKLATLLRQIALSTTFSRRSAGRAP